MSANLANNALRALARTAVRSASAPGAIVIRPSIRAVKPVLPSFSAFASSRSFSLSAYRRAEDEQPRAQGQELFPIFVGNVPYAANSAWLRTLFKQFGEVDDAVMLMSDGRSRGFGFVHFKTAEARESALRMDGREVEGRVLVVAESKSPRRTGPSFGGPRPEAPRGAYLIVDQIGATTRMSEILASWRARNLPEPTSSRLIVDRRTGLGKGHAYFDFASADEAEKVLRSLRDDPLFLREEGQQEGAEEPKSLRAHYANPRPQSAIRGQGSQRTGFARSEGRSDRGEGGRAYGDEFGGGQ